MRLKDYQGNSLNVKGVVWAPVKYEKEDQTLPIVVVEDNRPALLRRNWLEEMKLDWANIFQMTEGSKKSFHKQVDILLQKHKAVFEEGYGAIRGFKATVHLKPTARPVFKKARPAPFALGGEQYQQNWTD